MTSRWRFQGGPIPVLAALLLLALAGCDETESGPIAVSAIGAPPELANPNLKRLDAPSAFLVEAVAQGLVRFDAAGEIEPALAQRWTVSDDGLRYTFRLARTTWPNGGPITAEQVAARLSAAGGPSSRNALKPVLGAIGEVEPMIVEVLEISLKSPRPNFLQILAQPEMAIVRGGQGSGPFVAAPQPDSSVLLTPRGPADPEEAEAATGPPPVVLRGETAALAVTRFKAGLAELVTGGTLGDLPIARASRPQDNRLVFDPVTGLLGLVFASRDGPLGDPEVRQALAMALDRAAIVEAMGAPRLRPRETLVAEGVAELPRPAAPAWAALLPPNRRLRAAQAIAAVGEPVTVRVAMPQGTGYRLLFAYLKRDWRAIGVSAELVGPGAPADLRLIDSIAPSNLATWYLRHFTCEAGPVCDRAADEMLAAARIAKTAPERREQLAAADRALTDLAPYIAIAAPVRWSLVSPRLNGFRPNIFGRHPAGELVRATP